MSPRRRATLLVLACGCAVLAAVVIGRGGSSTEAPKSLRPFAPGSVWNAPLPRDAPLDTASGRLVTRLNQLVAADEARRAGPWINTNEYSTPVYTVPAGQSTVRVKLDQDNPALQAAFNAVPVPQGARPAAGTDGHMVVWQPFRDRMWEFWQARRAPDGWHAQWGGAMDNVAANPGYFTTAAWPGAQPNWGATATSLPLLGGLIRISEARARRVDHALALSLPEIRAGQHAFPAQRTDGRSHDPNAIPEGARFRLDPRVDVNTLNLPPLTRTIAQAAQRYGIIVRDYSGVVAFVGEDPAGSAPQGKDPWPAIYGDGRLPSQLLATFPWNRLQLVRMQVSGG
jgi:hypothetical protein